LKGGIKVKKSECKNESEKQYNVLVVDDESSVRRLIECLLQELKYNTHQACNGEEAIEILKKVNVDLIILDLLLPGKHGLDICSKIREMENLQNTPILIITAVYTKSKYNYQSKEYGANAFMTKPFEVDTFINEVSRLVNKDNKNDLAKFQTTMVKRSLYDPRISGFTSQKT